MFNMKIEKRLSKIDCWEGGNIKKFIIVHHTASSPQTTFENIVAFFNRKDDISVHYVVGREGQIAQLADENDRCFHAGKSQWGVYKDLNNYSIGIEVLSDGKTFTDKQIEATAWLCSDIMARNGITPDNVLRHADIAIPKGRKTDVGENFFKKWGSWAKFQESLSKDHKRKKLEKQYEEQAKVLNIELETLNAIKANLAAEKKVPFVPLTIK